MKVMLVDDDVFLRDMYAIKFTQCGHEIDDAEHAPAALAKLEQGNTYDVVLLDMIMPGMTGTELVSHIMRDYKSQVGGCIVLSNQGQEADIEEATEAGAIGYIIKASVIPSEVVDKVEKIMDKHNNK